MRNVIHDIPKFNNQDNSMQIMILMICFSMATHPLKTSQETSIPFNSYSASHDNWCTETLLNRVITAQCEGMGGSRVGEVRAGTTSPMPEHKGFVLQ